MMITKKTNLLLDDVAVFEMLNDYLEKKMKMERGKVCNYHFKTGNAIEVVITNEEIEN